MTRTEDDRSVYKVYVGNIDYEVDSKAVEETVAKFGEVSELILKSGASGYCFVSYLNKQCAEDCIDALNEREVFSSRRLRCEMAKGGGTARQREIERRENAEPNKTLFVVNFEPQSTQIEDLREFFSQWGELERIQLKTKFAFIEFETLDEARTALAGSQQAQFKGRRLTVEYVAPNSSKTGFAPGPHDRVRRASDAYPDPRGPPPCHSPQIERRSMGGRRFDDRDLSYNAGRLDRSRAPPLYRHSEYRREARHDDDRSEQSYDRVPRHLYREDEPPVSLGFDPSERFDGEAVRRQRNSSSQRDDRPPYRGGPDYAGGDYKPRYASMSPERFVGGKGSRGAW